MWLFDAGVFLAVIFSNIYWEWTPNHILAGAIGALTVYLVNRLAAGFLWACKKLLHRQAPHQVASGSRE